MHDSLWWDIWWVGSSQLFRQHISSFAMHAHVEDCMTCYHSWRGLSHHRLCRDFLVWNCLLVFSLLTAHLGHGSDFTASALLRSPQPVVQLPTWIHTFGAPDFLKSWCAKVAESSSWSAFVPVQSYIHHNSCRINRLLRFCVSIQDVQGHSWRFTLFRWFWQIQSGWGRCLVDG